MRQSHKTGKFIYEDIRDVLKGIEEIEKAMDEIENSIGTSSLGYKLLAEKKVELGREYQKLANRKYVEVHNSVPEINI